MLTAADRVKIRFAERTSFECLGERIGVVNSLVIAPPEHVSSKLERGPKERGRGDDVA